MVPVALAFIFNIRQWWKNEDGLKKKLISVPFLVLQLYPPFAALRLVVYLITRNKKWFEAKKIYDLGMTSIGKFSELITNYLLEKKQPYLSLDHLSFLKFWRDRFTHINPLLLDIPFLSEALSGERIGT